MPPPQAGKAENGGEPGEDKESPVASNGDEEEAAAAAATAKPNRTPKMLQSMRKSRVW